MAWRVRWTEVALADLKAVHDYIANDSRHYAAAFVRRIRTAARSLSRLPERARVVPEFKHPAVRELIVGNYRLIYHVGDKVVDVVAVIHGARDLKQMWLREGRPGPPA